MTTTMTTRGAAFADEAAAAFDLALDERELLTEASRVLDQGEP